MLTQDTNEMTMQTRVLIADDRPRSRSGLKALLALRSEIQVVGEAANGQEAVRLVEELQPDVVLMDIKMPGMDGIELTRRVKQKYPSCNIIMLTLYDEYLTQAIDAGATGYLLKDIKHEELIRAIRAVREGRSPLNLSLTQEQLAELAAPVESKQRAYLSERELSILRLIAEGVTTKEIATNVTNASQGIAEVNENVAQSNNVATEINRDISEVNQSTGEISNSSSHVDLSSNELKKLSGELKEMVNRFRI